MDACLDDRNGRKPGADSPLERSSIEWTDGTFARARDWRERAKVPLPLHESDERSGSSRGSRYLLAAAAAVDAIRER